MTKKTQKPVNQKSLYYSFADLYEKIMNDEISVEKSEQAVKALCGMNSVYGNEIKRAKIENKAMRIVELKKFDEKQIDE